MSSVKRIAILGAMREEVEPLLPKLGDYETVQYAGNTFYLGALGGVDVVVAYSKIGKVNAALTACVMVEKFGAVKLLFTGVAGGVDPRLKVGDLVFATKLVQHDVDITAFGHPHGFIPESEHYVSADANLLELARSVASELGLNVVEGVVATGDQFVANSEKKNWIASTYNAVALEMEGASVAAVCHLLNVPFFVLRSISDTADEEAGMSFDEFLVQSATTSAAFMTAMVSKLGK